MRKTLVPAALLLSLASCGSYDPLPSEADIDVNGTFRGRIIESDDTSALFSATIVERERNVTATIRFDSGDTFVLSGTRSVYKASPVSLVAVSQTTSDASTCPEKASERLQASITFYANSGSRKEGATGQVTRFSCDVATGELKRMLRGSGALELVRE